MPDSRRPLLSPQLLTGVIVFGFGVLLLLSNLGYADLREPARFWPAGLMVLGLIKIVNSRCTTSFFGGLFWLGIGTWLLLNNMGIIRLSFWEAVATFWPAALVALGLSIIFRTFNRGHERLRQAEVTNDVRSMQILGGTKRVIASPDFRQAEVSAILGGVDIDLSRSTMAAGPHGGPPVAVMDVYGMWSGIELRVPEGWVVDPQLSSFLSGYEDVTRPSSDPRAPRLILRGSVVMSGIEIKN